MTAIVYTSNTGFTAEYANLLGKEINLPVYTIKDAKKQLPAGSQIIYLGWIMANTINGYKDALKRFSIPMVCGVGMNITGSNLNEVRQINNLSDETVLFTLQGGFNLEKLKGFKRFIINVISKKVSMDLLAKTTRTPEEENLLDLFQNGGSRVSLENLKGPLDWYNQNK